MKKRGSVDSITVKRNADAGAWKSRQANRNGNARRWQRGGGPAAEKIRRRDEEEGQEEGVAERYVVSSFDGASEGWMKKFLKMTGGEPQLPARYSPTLTSRATPRIPTLQFPQSTFAPEPRRLTSYNFAVCNGMIPSTVNYVTETSLLEAPEPEVPKAPLRVKWGGVKV